MISPNAPAFPAPEAGQAHFGDPSAYLGLTQRDEVAVRLVAALVASTDGDGFVHPDYKREVDGPTVGEKFAEIAYKLADYMIEESKPK